jgi:hypothetical protein
MPTEQHTALLDPGFRRGDDFLRDKWASFRHARRVPSKTNFSHEATKTQRRPKALLRGFVPSCETGFKDLALVQFNGLRLASLKLDLWFLLVRVTVYEKLHRPEQVNQLA